MTHLLRLVLLALALAVLPLQSMAARSVAPCPAVETVKSLAHGTMTMEQHHVAPIKSAPATADWCKGCTACGVVAVALPTSDVVVTPLDKISDFHPTSRSLRLQEFPHSLLRPPRFLA